MARIATLEDLRRIVPDPGPHAGAKLRDRLCEQGIAFVRRSPFLMLATVGAWGLEISQKGGGPGFVEVVDDRTLLIPERRGNQLLLGLGNILADPRVGLAMLRPATDEVLRISGRASLTDDREILERLAARGEPALLAICVQIDRAAFHCVRSARRAGLWDPATWDAPTRVNFGRIYADALGRPEIEPELNRLAEISDARL